VVAATTESTIVDEVELCHACKKCGGLCSQLPSVGSGLEGAGLNERATNCSENETMRRFTVANQLTFGYNNSLA
jgi:hypothetical protein